MVYNSMLSRKPERPPGLGARPLCVLGRLLTRKIQSAFKQYCREIARGGQRSELWRQQDAPPSNLSQPRTPPYTFYGPRGVAVVLVSMVPTCGVAIVAEGPNVNLKLAVHDAAAVRTSVKTRTAVASASAAAVALAKAGFSQSCNTGGSHSGGCDRT